jgi:hypothetical protein
MVDRKVMGESGERRGMMVGVSGDAECLVSMVAFVALSTVLNTVVNRQQHSVVSRHIIPTEDTNHLSTRALGVGATIINKLARSNICTTTIELICSLRISIRVSTAVEYILNGRRNGQRHK